MSTLQITESFQRYLGDERHFSPYTARCYGADLRQFFQAELQTQDEEQEDDAELGQGFDVVLVADQRKGRRVWPDNDPRENVTKHHRLLQLAKHHRDECGNDHDDGQVLQESDMMHLSG